MHYHPFSGIEPVACLERIKVNCNVRGQAACWASLLLPLKHIGRSEFSQVIWSTPETKRNSLDYVGSLQRFTRKEIALTLYGRLVNARLPAEIPTYLCPLI